MLRRQEEFEDAGEVDTTLELGGKSRAGSNHSAICSKSIKTKKSSKSSTEMKKLEMELEAERNIAEIKENLIRKQLQLDLLRIDEDIDEGSEIEGSKIVWVRSDDLVKSIDKNMMIHDWIERSETREPFPNFNDEILENRNESEGNDSVRITLRKHSLDRKLAFFDGNPAEWLMFINEYYETTKLCLNSDNENLIRLHRGVQ